MKKDEVGNTYQRKTLDKTISFRDYLSIGIGSMIGIGWVVVAGDWLTRGGPLGAILGFIIGGFLLVTVGKCYAELTSAMPVAGGELAFSYKAFGRGVSFLTGWLIALDYTIVCPFETVALGWLFETILPSAKTPQLYVVGGYPVGLSSILPGVIVGFIVIFLNYQGVKNSAIFQRISLYILLVCVVIFVTVAIVKGSVSNMTPFFAGKGSVFGSIYSIIAVLAIVHYFLAGFDIIPQAAEEAGKKVNPRDLGKAIIISILAGVVFYVAIIMAISFSMPWQEAVKLEMPTAEVFRAAFEYDWAAKLVLIAALMGLITSLNGTFIAATRLIFSAGRGGLMPRWFEGVNEKRRTPKNAILFVGMIALIGPFVGRSLLIPVVNVGALAFISAVWISCLSAVKLRKTDPMMNRPYRVKNVSTLYAGVIISGILILLLVVPGSPGQLKWPSEYLFFAVWIFLGYLGYLWRKSKKDLTEEERGYQILGN